MQGHGIHRQQLHHQPTELQHSLLTQQQTGFHLEAWPRIQQDSHELHLDHRLGR